MPASADSSGSQCGARLSSSGASKVSKIFLVLVCVGTQCVPSVAARVVAKIYRPFF